MKKIFAPLNRWNFFLCFLIFIGGLWVLSRFAPFIFSFDSELKGLMWSSLFIALFLLFQRARDIFGKWWQALLLLPLFWIDDLLEVLKIPYAGWIAGPFFVVLLLFLFFKKGKNAEKFVWERKIVLKRVSLVGLIVGFLLIVAYSPYKFFYVIDHRMYPTVSANDGLLISRFIKGNSIDRGDLVIPEIPSYDERVILHLLRVIGLPNEEIKLDGNKIYINGKLFADEFAFYGKNLEPINFQETIHLDGDSYFLMGDNRYRDPRGKLFFPEKDKWFPLDKLEPVYQVAKRDELFGKVIGIHYENYKVHNKQYPNFPIQRNAPSYAFIKKDKKFGVYPNSLYDDLFGNQ